MALRFNMAAVETKRADILACSAELHRIADEIPADIRKLDAIATAMDNLDACTHAIENFGVPAVNVMNVSHQFDDIICKFNKATTSAQAIEGFMDKAKGLGGQFVEMLKRVLDKIKVWIKLVVEKIRHALFDKANNSLVKKIRAANISDTKVMESMSGGINGNAVVGKTVLRAICSVCRGLNSTNSRVSQLLNCKDVDAVNKALREIFYDTGSPARSLNERFFIAKDANGVDVDSDKAVFTSPHEYFSKASDAGFDADDPKQLFTDSDMNNAEGLGISEIAELETASKDMANAFMGFEIAAGVYADRVKSSLDHGVDESQKQVYTAMVKGLSAAVSSNLNVYRIIDEVINKILAGMEKKIFSADDDKCPRCGWKKTPGDTECRNCHTRFGEKYEGPKTDKSKSNGGSNIGLQIKARLDELVKANDVAQARTYVISLIDNTQTLPWILKAGDFLNKNIEGGIYDTDSGIDMNWDIDYLKGVLKRQFRRGILQRIIQLSSKQGGQSTAVKTTSWDEIKIKLDGLVEKGNKIDAKVFIIGMADKSRSAMTPFILKAADYLNDHLEGGLYDEEVEIDQSYDMNYCKAALRMDFTRGYISRILQLFQENRKKGTN